MNNDDILHKNDVQVQTTPDTLTCLSKLTIDKTEGNNLHEEASSGGSSPSALKKRLQDLPSFTNENTRSIDFITSLNHRLSHGHRLNSPKDYNEKNNEETFINESPSGMRPLQGARARRRAKIRSEILEEIDKSLSIAHPKVTNLLNFLAKTKNESDRVESSKIIGDSMETFESRKIADIEEISMLQFQPTTFTGSLTSRSCYYSDDDRKHEPMPRLSKSAKENRISYDVKSNRLLKNKVEFNPISQLSANNVRPMKCGGYRPYTGVILKNLSSSSESESVNESSNYVSQKINSPATNTELSSPMSKTTVDERIFSVLSARSDYNQELPSFRSFQETIRSGTVNGRDRKRNNAKIFGNDVNTFVENVDPYLDESPTHRNEIGEKNDLNSLPLRSALTSSRSKMMWTEEEKEGEGSYAVGSENEGRENDPSSRKQNFKSINDLSVFPKCQTERRIEHFSCPSSAKNVVEREDFFLATNSVRFCSEGHLSGPTACDNKQDEIPSFLNIRLIENLETLNASDNERHDNTSVPSLPLYSEDVSCSTSVGSKTYTQNRSLDNSALTKALSNVSSILNSRDKENASTRTRYRSFDDSENIDTSESSDQNLILAKTWQEPASTGSRNVYERYNELDVAKQTRRAFSAPSSKLHLERSESVTIDGQTKEDSNIDKINNLRMYMQDGQRCKSVDTSRETIYVKENLNEFPESFYSSKTNLTESLGNLNYVEEYQMCGDPLEMSYSQEEDYNAYPLECLITSMYPRQSHLSVLQEESETRLEENSRSDSVVGNKDTSVTNSNCNNINRSESAQRMSTSSSTNRNIEDETKNETKNETENNKNEKTDLVACASNENCYSLSKESSEENPRHTWSIPISTNATSTCYNAIDKKPSVQTNQEDKMKNANEEGDNEFLIDESRDVAIDTNNQIKGTGLTTWTMNDESSKLQFSKTIQPENAMFVIQKIHEICTVPPKVSYSTSKLQCASERIKKSPRSKSKKSQDRFPFTISETKSMISTKHEVGSKQGHCENVCNKTRSLETFREFTYPTVIDFSRPNFDYFTYSERQEQRNILPKMKGFVRRFSKKLKVPRRHNDDTDKETSTKVIYQNQECQNDSMPESSSDESTIKESRWIVPRSGNTRSSIISSSKSLKKTMSLENLTLPSEYPRRRYDRDDQWVKELKEQSSQRTTSSKERFSIFTSRSSSNSLVEDFSKVSAKRSRDKGECTTCKKKEDRVNTSVSSSPSDVIKSNVNEINNERNPDIDEISTNTESGCICFKFYRTLICSFFVPSKDQTSKIRNDSLIEIKRKKYRFSLRRNKDDFFRTLGTRP
ncbi:serine-rich adhesin for platelets-like [Vespula squamosa]|uniref:Serine-rich adhesin for platelets-like n=1 Tax=Vespula squamosa TaxID=30214 RepID=A0ABD2BT56_VESSQ